MSGWWFRQSLLTITARWVKNHLYLVGSPCNNKLPWYQHQGKWKKINELSLGNLTKRSHDNIIQWDDSLLSESRASRDSIGLVVHTAAWTHTQTCHFSSRLKGPTDKSLHPVCALIFIVKVSNRGRCIRTSHSFCLVHLLTEISCCHCSSHWRTPLQPSWTAMDC